MILRIVEPLDLSSRFVVDVFVGVGISRGDSRIARIGNHLRSFKHLNASWNWQSRGTFQKFWVR
jgi:hypothetical protein